MPDTPGTPPGNTGPMPRCPNQRHIRARPPTQIMHRIRRHPPTTPRTCAPGPELLTTRTNRWDIPRMSTRTSGGPPGVPGLLDHETQIRPRAHKNHPTSGKRSGTANLHDRNGTARTTRHAKTASIRAWYGPNASPWIGEFQPTRSSPITYTPVARSTLMAGAHDATPHRPEPTMSPPNTQQPAQEPRSAQTSPTGHSSDSGVAAIARTHSMVAGLRRADRVAVALLVRSPAVTEQCGQPRLHLLRSRNRAPSAVIAYRLRNVTYRHAS
jgi:hypothetical protein